MAIIRPRLTDYYGVLISQAEADFATPFIDEDIPLYLDPFLLWRSPSQQDNALHTAIINSFNHLGYLEKQRKHSEAVQILTALILLTLYWMIAVALALSCLVGLYEGYLWLRAVT